MDDSLQPAEGQCAFFLPKKKRFCRFRPNQGQQYCPEHACVLGVKLERKRIQCPLDPKHTCYEDSLAKHLKKCNNNKKRTEEYYEEGLNTGSDDGDYCADTQTAVKEMDTEKLKGVIERVNRLFDEHVGKLPEDVRSHECLKEEMNNPMYKLAALRHRRQQASLIGQLEAQGLLESGHCYVEMGAGKGQLSHWVREAVSHHDDASFLLVDRSSVRYKVDGYHKEEEKVKFERIKIDIEHLNLGKVPMVADCDRPLVAIGKHLCGAATDLTLRCLMQTLGSKPPTAEPTPPPTDQSSSSEPHPKRPRLQADDTTKAKKFDTPENSAHSQKTASDVPSADRTQKDDTWGSQKNQVKVENASRVMKNDVIVCESVNAVNKDTVRENSDKDGCHSISGKDTINISENSSEARRMTDTAVQAGDANQTEKRNKTENANKIETIETDTVSSETEKKRRTEAETSQTEKKKEADKNVHVSGVLIALCCHHQCRWRAYVGKDFMRQCGFTAADFHLLTRLSSWAVCGWRDKDGSFSKQKVEGGSGDDANVSADMESGVEGEAEHDTTGLMATDSKMEGLQLTEKQKEVVGWRCKRLIDYGRALYLQQHGMSAQLKIYIDSQQTPENVVLVAVPAKRS